MRIAFFSDIHGNLPALEAALEDAKARGARHLICLGDIVGYGPQPVECLKKIRDIASATVIGNHDAAVCGLFDKERFNTFARETAERVELALSEDDRAWLRGLPYQIEGNGFFCTHGSFNEPEAFDYLSEREDAALSFALYPEVSLFFVGHTHIPCVFVEDGQADGLPRKLPPEDLSLHEGLRYIINPGTIGFPRGDQLTADYVLFDTVTRRISFHCVEYDMAPYRLALVNNGYNLLNYWFLSPKASRRRTELAMRAMASRRVTFDEVYGFGLRKRSKSVVFHAIFYSIAILLFVFMGIVLSLVLKVDHRPVVTPFLAIDAGEDTNPLGKKEQWHLTPSSAVSFTLEGERLHLQGQSSSPVAFTLESPRLMLEDFGKVAKQYFVSYLPQSTGKVQYTIQCTYYRADGSSVKGSAHKYTSVKPVKFKEKCKAGVEAVVIRIDGTLYGSLTLEHFSFRPD